jgi:hypothetical protein
MTEAVELRTLIVGLPGSGKTTLARDISALTGVEVYQLDQVAWNDDGIKPLAERIEIARSIAERPSWIADGLYVGWTRLLMERAHVVVKMEVPLRTALWRIFWRHVRAEMRRDNAFPGWRRLCRFMRNVRREYRGTYGAFSAEDYEVSPAVISRELEPFGAKLLVNPEAQAVIGRAPGRKGQVNA